MFFCFRKPNGDYRSSPMSKDRSRSPIGSVVVPGGLGVHNNHLYSHAHHHHHHHLVSLVGMDQPLALTKNSTVESARTSTAIMATVPHAVGVAERQQVSSTGFWAHLTFAGRALRPWTFFIFVPAESPFRDHVRPRQQPQLQPVPLSGLSHRLLQSAQQLQEDEQ